MLGVLLRVACTLLLTIRFEAFMESDGALRNASVERQHKKHLLMNTFKHKFRGVGEPEFSVVVRMSHEATPLSIYISQS